MPALVIVAGPNGSRKSTLVRTGALTELLEIPAVSINAGDIAHAIDDVHEVGQLYQNSNSRGIKWACVTGTAIAAATKPEATVDSVLGAIFDHCDADMVVREIDRELKRTAACKDIRELSRSFDSVYNGVGMPYCMSFANEVVTKAVCIFRMVQGNLKDAVISGVNMGRDTDCVTAVASGISGALTGGSSLPPEWIAQLDHATSLNPYTSSQRTLNQWADELHHAFHARLNKMRRYVSQMDGF